MVGRGVAKGRIRITALQAKIGALSIIVIVHLLVKAVKEGESIHFQGQNGPKVGNDNL